NPVDRATAWVMAAVYCLHQYHDLLENEWRERVYTYWLHQLTSADPNAAPYAQLYRQWELQRPYERGAAVEAGESYPHYRRRQFDHFLAQAVQNLPTSLRHELAQRIRTAEAEELPAYQRQLSILAYLDPGPYGETRIPVPLKQIHIGLIHQGAYYLLPACAPGTDRPPDIEAVREQIATILAQPANPRPAPLAALARLNRATWPNVRQKLNGTVVKQLDALRYTPILLNCDQRPRHLPLAEVRQAERGALAWAVYLKILPPAQPRAAPLKPLHFQFKTSELTLIQQAPTVVSEVSAETDAVNVTAILRLRQAFKQRSAAIELTINDLLILYRAVHAVTYQPAPRLTAELQKLSRAEATREAAEAALEALQSAKLMSPAIVIPVDACRRSPRDRLYPMTFEVPLHDLDLLNLHQRTIAAQQAYRRGNLDYAKFNQLRGRYLRFLAEFGRMLNAAKKIALTGESASVGTIKLLAHLPTPLQRMLDQVPSRFDFLNDLIRGREVFSNVGAVAPTSTLTRFITAKDDNDKKTLAWGVITDAQGVMRLTLRDFRPHVGMLAAAGYKDLALSLTQHYLDAYASGLNQFIADLRAITETSK
ncbi:MAG: hypothetical protein HYR94_01375, partial [Chloroflexi bacterium]|nr:hypothetical protein [Chloroflexota bacterium]